MFSVSVSLSCKIICVYFVAPKEILVSLRLGIVFNTILGNAHGSMLETEYVFQKSLTDSEKVEVSKGCSLSLLCWAGRGSWRPSLLSTSH